AASLAWMPQEMILFDRARLKRAIDIDLAADARLLLAEAIVFGRSGMGEAVHDGFLFDRWRLRRGGRLIHAEAMRLDGAGGDKPAAPAGGGPTPAEPVRSGAGGPTTPAPPAVAKGGIALATVLIVPGDEVTAATVRALSDQLRGEAGVS